MDHSARDQSHASDISEEPLAETSRPGSFSAKLDETLRPEFGKMSRRRSSSADSEKAGKVWAREVDDEWWPCILTLDGGGVRGYSSLLLLEALMHQVWLWELRLDTEGGKDDDGERNSLLSQTVTEDELKPCHYFDFMFGTSSGGIIATLLGRLRFTVKESMTLFRELNEAMFGRQRSSVPLATKYHHSPFEKQVQAIVGSQCREHPECNGNENLFPLGTDRPDDDAFKVDAPRPCHTCCLAATQDGPPEAYLHRTYQHCYSEEVPNWITRYNEGADELPIWTVLRATTATPFYFPAMQTEVHGIEKMFRDAAIRENNPSGAALSEFHALYEGKAPSPALLLSIGVGRPEVMTTSDGLGLLGATLLIGQWLRKRAVVQNLVVKETDGERQHQNMRAYAQGEHTWYKRFNVDIGLQDLQFDTWTSGRWNDAEKVPGGATLTTIEKATAEYLSRDFDAAVDSYAPPKVMLQQTAEKLVRQRRARQRMGGPRWEAFVKPESGTAESSSPRMGKLDAISPRPATQEKFLKGDQVYLDLSPSKASAMVVNAARGDLTTRRLEYQLRTARGALYNRGEWVDQRWVSGR